MRFSSDGWVSTAMTGVDEQAGQTFGLHVRAGRDEDGRLVITDLYLHGSQLTNEMVRSLSIPRLQASLNASSYVIVADEDEDAHLTMRKLRSRADPDQHTSHGSERERLTRPDGTDPEAFYRLVAKAYVEYAAETKAPAKAIADEAQVPATSVHRWVREARRRGFLPPARKGHVL